MIDTNLKCELERIAKNYSRFQFWRGLALLWGFLALIGSLLILLYWISGWSSSLTMPCLAAGALAGMAVSWRISRKLQPSILWIAREIEQQDPKLKTLLLAALDQHPDQSTGQFGYLQLRVIAQALEQNRKRPWVQPSVESLFFAQVGNAAAFVFLLLVLVGLGFTQKPPQPAMISSDEVQVLPGDASIERGRSVLVTVRFTRSLPAATSLIVQEQSNPARQIALSRSFNDPLFGGSINEITNILSYYVEYSGRRTRAYRITVFDFPALERADARLEFPDYTGLPDQAIEDTRRISAVEGSTLTLSLSLNKPVVSANLVAKDQPVIRLQLSPTNQTLYISRMLLEKSQRYELLLRDSEGRTNKAPAQFDIAVHENQAPDFKLTFPRQDIRVSALEELMLQAQVWDDFGLKNYGLAFALGGEEPKILPLGQTNLPNEKKMVQHLLSFEQLEAKPDQLLTYFFWADDVGPDGQLRRASSDMYFAEVRPFEEIFRPGQDAAGGGGGGGSMSSPLLQLAELQKQIINATWNVHRRQAGPKPTRQYQKDVSVIHQSQQTALDQAGDLKNKAADPEIRVLADQVEKEMKNAVKHLNQAQGQNSLDPLPAALTAEQAAYQALLKLQAREYRVSRSRGQGGGGAGDSRSQAQLDQLEFTESENRYETQRQAAPQQTAQQREQLQVLNRLRELAQRQQDLNQRLKELQSALPEAKSEQEREEIRRQLKRLRDEEQKILADLDELRQRMSDPENRSQMGDAIQQLDQTRSDIRKTSEELANEAVSQALASGTRAERELAQLRDEFRKMTSSRFSDEMRQMRADARELAQNQEEIARKLEAKAQEKRKTLDDGGETQSLADRLQQQKTSLTNLFQHARRVSEQSENSEPLLSKQLYDSLRKTNQEKIDEALAFSSELLKRSFLDESSDYAERALSDISQFKEGIERAAESVLGDEAEALRFTKRELDTLYQQLEKEIAQADPQENDATQNAQAADGPNQEPNQNSAQTPAASSGNQANPNASNPGQNQPGSQQGSQGQGSEGQHRTQNNQTSAAARSRSGSPNSSAGAGGNRSGQQSGDRQSSGATSGRNFFDGGFSTGPGGPEGPITGTDYLNWSDRLRNVEELLDSPELRRDVARVRDRAKGMRIDIKRHGKEPQWDLVRAQIAAPLAEVRDRVAEELARRETSHSLVPLDRDPVPPKYSERVRRYYEQLGKD